MKAISLFRCLALPAAAATALFFTACSTPQSRIEENPTIAARLSPNDRALATSGRVREGMNKDGVFIAWGRPDRVYRGTHEGRSMETWIFTTREVRYAGGYGAFPYPIYGGGYYVRRGGRYYRGYGLGYGFYDPFYFQPTYSVEVPFRRATFANGKLVSFSERE